MTTTWSTWPFQWPDGGAKKALRSSVFWTASKSTQIRGISFAKVPFPQLHSEGPVGRVSYSQGTGNKVIVKYGEVSEDCYCPVLGLIPEKDLPAVKKVGKLMWDNYYMDKRVYTVKFEKGEEN